MTLLPSCQFKCVTGAVMLLTAVLKSKASKKRLERIDNFKEPHDPSHPKSYPLLPISYIHVTGKIRGRGSTSSRPGCHVTAKIYHL